MPSELFAQIPPKRNNYVDFTGVDYLSPVEFADTRINVSKGVIVTTSQESLREHTGSKTAAFVDSIAKLTTIRVPRRMAGAHMTLTNDISHREIERLSIVLEEGASANVVWEGRGGGFFAQHVELVVGEGASLTFSEVQDFTSESKSFSRFDVMVRKDANLVWSIVTLGSGLQSVEREISLVGEGAQADIIEVFFGDKEQLFDHDVILRHEVPNTRANLLSRGILRGGSKSVFVGLIKIVEGAQKTNSFLAQHAMLLSPDAKCDAVPSLEIAANDVKASHSASVGPIDAEHVFYLMSRGIEKLEAERLIALGFLAPVLEGIQNHEIKERVREAFERKWNSI